MNSSNKYNDLEWAIGPNRRILIIVGLWPRDSKNTNKILRSKFRLLFSLLTMILILMIPTLIALLRVWGDMILVIDNLQFSLPLTITLLKTFIMCDKKEALALLIDMIEKDWIKSKMERERNVMLRQAKITRIFTICGTIMIAVMVAIYVISFCFGITFRHVTNLTDSEKPLPIQTYYLYDITRSPQYELMVLVQLISQTFAGLTYTGVDSFLGLLTLHICGQMENLQWRLTYLKKDMSFDEALKINVEDHIRLIRSVQIIDDTFNLMLLGILFFFSILFCLHGFLLINVISQGSHLSVVELLWFVITSGSILMHVCLYCIVGELLVMQSEKIYRAVYKYKWYTVKPQIVRHLILIMLRANKPLIITAGKIFPMTMTTFCNLIKTSAGYVSVLLANKN